MYRLAYRYDDKTILYFDFSGNKYVATGGNLAWRINNPGLVRSHSHFAKRNKSIGSCKGYAIFPELRNGQKALQDWLHAKKYFDSTLKTLGEHYQPNNSEVFVQKVSAAAGFSPERKINSLNKIEFDALMRAIEKYCGYSTIGNEALTLLPKITAKIENGTDKDDTYLIGDSLVLSKEEAIEWILSHRLDGVVVHHRDGSLTLRSRPGHCIWNIKMHDATIPPSVGQIDTIMRVVGENKGNQCIWGFINGVSNTKASALKSAELISEFAMGDAVYSMPNDTAFGGVKDLIVCGILKITLETPIVEWTAKFFRYLLNLSEKNQKHQHVVVFAHSQGAIISEHALELLKESERKQIRIFTFGGGSFIAPEKCHPDSHNYASAADPICRLGSPNLQYLALQRYYALKKGLNLGQLIKELSFQDAILHLDTINAQVIEAYIQKRSKYYEREFSKISNVTVLDSDPGYIWEHRFDSPCYQSIIGDIVRRCQLTDQE
ncbi:MAG: hypothetical protein WB791_03085 [Waddliaceae bacterium]